MAGEEYRIKANELLMQSQVEANPDVKTTLLQLAQGYAHLAELMEKKPGNAPIAVPQAIQESVEQQTTPLPPVARKEE